MIPSILLAAAVLLSDSAPCQKATGLNPTALLQRAAERTGLPRSGAAVLKIIAFDVTSDAFQSDRMYPPALAEVARLEHWFDPVSGVERVAMHTTVGGYESDDSFMGDARASYVVARLRR